MGEGTSELFASATLMRPWQKPKSEEEKAAAAKERQKDGRTEAQMQKDLIKVNLSLCLLHFGRAH